MKLMRQLLLLLIAGLATGCSDKNDDNDTKAEFSTEEDGGPVTEAVTSGGARSDLEREARLAEQIIDTIFDGELVRLNADGHEFLGVHMGSQTGTSNKAALILHGLDYQPDLEQVARPLRIGLTGHEWNTLSLQMPVLEEDAKYYDYVSVFPESFPRIEAGIRYLEEQGNDTVVVIAHSCSVHMVMEWVRNREISGMDGFIGIGMEATDYEQYMKEPFPFEKIKVPILDIYGELDFPGVLDGAEDRLAAMQKAGNPLSKQVVLDEADHYMHEQDELLIKTVADWLNRVF